LYKSKWIPISEAVTNISVIRGINDNESRAQLVAALRDSEVPSRQRAVDGIAKIPPEQWQLLIELMGNEAMFSKRWQPASDEVDLHALLTRSYWLRGVEVDGDAVRHIWGCASQSPSPLSPSVRKPPASRAAIRATVVAYEQLCEREARRPSVSGFEKFADEKGVVAGREDLRNAAREGLRINRGRPRKVAGK
jgi:hypothetical protein